MTDAIDADTDITRSTRPMLPACAPPAGDRPGALQPPKADLALVRELNQRIVLDLLRKEPAISRAELARRSRLSRSTISNIIADLLAAGRVAETGTGSSRGGRRPIMIRLTSQPSFVVGVEIGNAGLTMLIADMGATVLRRARHPFNLAAGPIAGIAQLSALLNQTLAAAQIPRDQVLGVGLGLPGRMACAADRLIAPALLPGWHNFPLSSRLEQALGLRVCVENDANLGALAEQGGGAARGWQHVVYMYLGGACVGCGLILDGRLYHGDLGAAGEIGHLMIEEAGPACACGLRGCLEAVVGAPALITRARASGLACDRLEDLIRLARGGNAKAIELIDAAGNGLGIALASLLSIINPGRVVLGGGLAAAGDLLLSPVQQAVRRRTGASDPVAIVPGELGDEVIALGAARLILATMFDVPAGNQPGAYEYRRSAGREVAAL